MILTEFIRIKVLHFSDRFGTGINDDNIDATSKCLINTVHTQHIGQSLYITLAR